MPTTTNDNDNPPPPPNHAAAAETIARAVQRRFAALPGNGKPASHEHTVLAGFVVASPSPQHPTRRHYAVASLATGTKCLGAGRRREAAEARASLVHDSHAEALARRGLLLWVHAQLREALLLERRRGGEGGAGAAASASLEAAAAAAAAAASTPTPTTPAPSPPPLCFRWLPERRRFALLPGVELYLYVSQPPCGDASILHDSDGGGGGGGEEEGDEVEEPSAVVAAGGRTGAKLIEPAAASVGAVSEAAEGAGPLPRVPQAGEVEAAGRAQRKGALRRKPGKGDATLSMSCSDKLARWQALGLQGALLSCVLDAPLRPSGVVVSVPPPSEGAGGGGVVAARAQQEEEKAAVEGAVRRAVFDRFQAAIEGAADALRDEGGGPGNAGEAAFAAEQLLRSALHHHQQRQQQEPRRTNTAAPPPPPPPTLPIAMAALAPPAALGLAPSGSRRVPCGVAINWHSGASENDDKAKAEVTVGAAGCRAGSGRTARGSPATRSRLSRASLAARFAELLEGLEEQEEGGQRALPAPALPISAADARLLPLDALKRRAAPAYTRAWAALLLGSSAVGAEAAQFAGAWLRKPEDVLAVADYPTPAPQARADSAAAGFGSEGRGGTTADGKADRKVSKRARTGAP